MVTTALPDVDISEGYSARERYCDGCPRCTDDESVFCRDPHLEFNGLHPVCKKCGHCVLRGQHNDNTDDLGDH